MTAPFALFSLAYAAVWYIFTLNPLRRRLEPRTVERVFVLIYIAICTYCFIELFIHFQSAYLEKIPYDEWPDEARLSKDQQAFASFACYPSTNAIDL
jgi:dolichyl-phosphate-mannose--protein O-mannosyl transferase